MQEGVYIQLELWAAALNQALQWSRHGIWAKDSTRYLVRCLASSDLSRLMSQELAEQALEAAQNWLEDETQDNLKSLVKVVHAAALEPDWDVINFITCARAADRAKQLGKELSIQGWVSLECSTAQNVLLHLENHAVACLVMDFQDMDSEILQILRMVRSHPAGRDVPVIALLERPNMLDRAALLALGVTQCLDSNSSPLNMALAMRGQVAYWKSQSDGERRDASTGLPNMQAMLHEFSALQTEASQEDRALSVAYMRLQLHSEDSDSESEEYLMRQALQPIRKVTPVEGCLYRWSADTLMWVLPGMDEEQTRELLRRAQAELKEVQELLMYGAVVEVTDAWTPYHVERLATALLEAPAFQEEVLEPAAPEFDASLPHVLVVDDDPVIPALLTHFLERQTMNVSCARDGVEAMDMLGRYTFDAVLLDVNMPGKNGIEVLEAMRAEGENAQVPVLMMTLANEYQAQAKCFEKGANDYIVKPFSLNDLLSRLSRMLPSDDELTARSTAHLPALDESRSLGAPIGLASMPQQARSGQIAAS